MFLKLYAKFCSLESKYNNNTHQIQSILVNAPPSPWYSQPPEYLQASENRMEALELDTPTETVSIPENAPPSENLTADL